MIIWKREREREREFEGGVRPATPPPPPKPPKDTPTVTYNRPRKPIPKELLDDFEEEPCLTSVEILFANGITRTFTGEATRFEDELRIIEDGALTTIPIRNISYYAVKEMKG